MITALAGGVGAARFLQGLVNVTNDDIVIIINTGDDEEFFGLYVSPDIDIVAYTLAGIVDPDKGWGIKGDTFNCLSMLSRYGYETWFKIGDRDLATHIHRTRLIRSGFKLSEVAEDLRKKLGIRPKLVPMTDEKVRTMIDVGGYKIPFQEYLVKRGAKDEVKGVVFEGIERASPAPGVIDAIKRSNYVIICPSNPIVSIGTILAVRGVRDALKTTNARVIAISPIIGGKPVKGPADKLMEGLGLEVSAFSVAKIYSDFLDAFVIDLADEHQKESIEGLGIKVFVTNILMGGYEDKIRLARFVIDRAKEA